MRFTVGRLALSLSLILGAPLLSPPVQAASPVKVLGMSDMSCAAWKASKGDVERRAPYLQWVRGFLSGHNYANPTTQVAVVSEGTVEVFVDRFCAERASATVGDAAMRMSDQYSGRTTPLR